MIMSNELNTNTDQDSRIESPLNSAPAEVKLAVDLIYLLENNEIDSQVALNAIEIVKKDLERKIRLNVND